MSEIRNTTEEMRDPTNAQMFLLDQLGTPGVGAAIEDMERQGQAQLVNSDRLPTDARGDEAAYLALGFTFGPPDPRDPMFRPATLPPGWSRKGTDHSMWSKIVDQHGRERVSIFYKAAFYDRSAHMGLNTPYGYLSSLLYEGGTPVLDDEWLTPAVAVETLEKIAEQADDEAVGADEYAPTASDPSYWCERAAKHRATAANARALIAKVTS